MSRALSFAKGTLNPGNFLYPTLFFYVLFGWVGAYLGFVWLTGGVASVAALQELYFTHPTGIYTAGRVLGAVLGTLCVPAMFALGRRLFDTQARWQRRRSSPSLRWPSATLTTSNTTSRQRWP